MPVDYAALARQHGGIATPAAAPTPGGVDYAALARDIGGTPTAAPEPSPLGAPPSWTDVPRDLVRGAAAGAASTVYHGGDLLRRGWNVVMPGEQFDASRIINQPDVQAAMTPPDSTAGKLGFYGEQAAEFAVPLTRAARAVAGAPLLTRMLTEGAASAAVAGAQSGGNVNQMALAGAGGVVLPFAGAATRGTVRAAQRTAAGAREGGLGGAIAAGVRAVAPGEPRMLLVQALKPRSSKVQFSVALDRAMPEIKAAEGVTGQPITNVDTLLEAVKAAKQRIGGQLNQVRGQASTLEIDFSPVADAMVRSIPKKLRLENPEAAARLAQAAAAYRRRFSLADAETLLRETNAELDGLEAMFPRAKYAAIASNPAAAALDAQGKAIRQALDAGLDRMTDGGGAAAKELRRRYGALLEVEGEVLRRQNVAARQQPINLSEQIGSVRAAADMARGAWRLGHGDLSGAADIAAAHAGRSAATAIKDSQTTDALIRRAFGAFDRKPIPVVMPTRRPVAGLLERGPVVTPPPADPSFVRGVPTQAAYRARELPPATTIMETPPDPSSVTALTAKKVIIRDPRTGRMRAIWISEGR